VNDFCTECIEGISLDLKDLKFCQKFCWTLKCCGMWYSVIWVNQLLKDLRRSSSGSDVAQDRLYSVIWVNQLLKDLRRSSSGSDIAQDRLYGVIWVNQLLKDLRRSSSGSDIAQDRLYSGILSCSGILRSVKF